MSLLDAPPGGDDAAAAARRRRGPGLVALFVLFLGLAAAARIPTFSNHVFNSDEAYLATQAQALVHGAHLYVDTVDRKPPVVPYLYAAVFDVTGTSDLGPVRVLAVLAHALTALLLAAEARRRFAWRHAPLAAGLLYLLAASALRPTDAQAANFEVFMLPAMTAAMLLGSRRRPGASGIAVGVATLVKQTAAVTLLPLAYLAWRARRGRGVVSLALAAAVPVAVAAVGFGWHDFMRWVFTSNGGYLDAEGVLGYALRNGLSQTKWFLAGSGALVVLLPFAWRDRRADVDLWLWLGAGVVAVVAGLRFFGHYYLQLVPPLVLLALRGLTTTPLRARPVAVALVAGVTAVCAAAFLVPAFTFTNTRDTDVAIAVGRYFASHTSADARVLVWGQAPEAYWTADRRPAVRFATTGFVTGTSGGRPYDHVGERYAVPGAWRDFLADLHAHPPVLVADMSTADQRHASYYPPSRFPEFARWLTEGGWHRVATVDGVAILAPGRR